MPGSDDVKDVGFKNMTCFVEIGDKVNTILYPNTDIVMSENIFETIEEAYAWEIESWTAMAPKLLKLQARNSEIEEEHIQLMQQLDMAGSRNVKLLEKHEEIKKIIDDFDTTTVEKLNSEVNDANDIIACLEAEKTKLAKDVSLNLSIICS